jgi:hypothetical protein
METTRNRFGSRFGFSNGLRIGLRIGGALEWALAAAVIFAVLAAGSIVIREARTVRPVMPVIASEAPAVDTSAALPERAVSVPMLLLGPEATLRIADRESDITRLLGAAARASVDTIERVNGLERITRAYDYLGTRFVLVFEAVRPGGEARVTAIYRQ